MFKMPRSLLSAHASGGVRFRCAPSCGVGRGCGRRHGSAGTAKVLAQFTTNAGSRSNAFRAFGRAATCGIAAVLRGLLQHCSNPPIASQGLSLLCALCMQSDASNHCPSWWIASSIHPDLINGRDTQVGRIFASHSRDSRDYIRVFDQRLDPAPTVLQAVRWNLSEKLAPLCHGSQP
jgi:hypothetical protein